ncbi:MAG: methanethiol S-methyltransferase [Bacteroidota bacterium]
MVKAAAFVYGIAAYLLSLAVFLYAVGFIADWLVPKSIDSGTQAALAPSLLVNFVLLGLFAVQHSAMARPGFKRWWTRVVPTSIERSTYVLLSSLALILLFSQWRPLQAIVWDVRNPAAAFAIRGLYAFGWLIAVASTFLISHFDLFGLRQVYLNLRRDGYSFPGFKIVGLYNLVRHPIMLGFVVAFWATPRMSLGHLVFSVAMTVYMLAALRLEERDLVTDHGDAYRQYQKRVPMLVPLLRRSQD